MAALMVDSVTDWIVLMVPPLVPRVAQMVVLLGMPPGTPTLPAQPVPAASLVEGMEPVETLLGVKAAAIV